ncbi:uncharacterized protein LOC107810248 [Nicotiana tabacum]|uniref:Uncharacterized protein LOC107810248 n=1 Tax=Nicotiana tabacum TaxID=4097 RepID=A0AC58UTU9_TOBAC
MIINLLVNSPKGSLFPESVDASDSSTDSTKMYSLFKSTIDFIGAENVSSNFHGQRQKDHLVVFNQAIRVHSYIVQRPLLLNMMKRFTKQRSLVKPTKTRFATTFLTLHRMYEQKSNLKKLFVSDQYTNSAYGREARRRKSADIILSPSFWNNVVHALKISGPLVKVLHLVDGEQRPPIGYLWDSKLHSPLHATGLVLKPELFYDNEERILEDEPLWNGYYECIEKLIPEESVQDKVTEQFSIYRNAEQLFGKNMAIRQRKTKSPVEWWKQYGHSTPDLQKFAIKIHTKKRNKLTLRRLNDLVFIKYNRILRRRYNACNVIDPISLDNIDDANEWITGVPEDHVDEEKARGSQLAMTENSGKQANEEMMKNTMEYIMEKMSLDSSSHSKLVSFIDLNEDNKGESDEEEEENEKMK